MFRLGVVFNFIYIMAIVLLREKVVENLWLISILYGISQSTYWFPYNLLILSFMFTPDNSVSKLKKYNMVETWNKIKKNKQIKKIFLVKFLIGFSVSDGALGTLITILIFNAFKTDMNLGIITSISTILSMGAIKLYEKNFKNKSDKKILIFSSIIPVISVLALLFSTNNITIIIYNL